MTDFEGAPPGTSTEEVRAARKARQEQAAADKLAEEAKAKALKASEVAHGNGNKKARLEDGSAEGSGSGGVDVGSGFINPANLTKPTENGSGNDSGINPSSTQLNVNNSQSNDNGGNEPEGSGTGESRKRKPSAQSDEIGSDLDDPSDEEAGNFDDLDDENLGLCLYEKVSFCSRAGVESKKSVVREEYFFY